MKRRVVITGMGTLNPLGNDVTSTWEAVLNGRSGIGPITQFDTSEQKSRFAGEVRDFDPVALFGRKEARRMDRVTQFAVAAANQALAGAALDGAAIDRDRVGVIIGSGLGAIGANIEAVQAFGEKGPGRVNPFYIPMMLADTPAAVVAIEHGFRGPNMSVATACATSNNALGEAARMIQAGLCDVMVAGASEACILPLPLAAFSVMGALSARNDAPQAASRPFDLDRDGFVLSEGSGVVILEELAHARARGAQILAEFVGYGSSADAYHISQPAADGSGAALSMSRALADAGLQPGDIDYINAHGTSTPLNDSGETAAIKLVFGAAAYEVPVSSTKSLHGHLLGAAGALEAVIVVQALRHAVLPPTINYETPDPACDLDYVPNVPRPGRIRRAMSNSFGLGGHNATIILGQGPG